MSIGVRVEIGARLSEAVGGGYHSGQGAVRVDLNGNAAVARNSD